MAIGSRSRKLASHIFIHTQEVEEINRKWDKDINFQILLLVTHFFSYAVLPKGSLISPKTTKDQEFKYLSLRVWR